MTAARPDRDAPSRLGAEDAARHDLSRHRSGRSRTRPCLYRGDLDIHGVHPGDPYELLKALAEKLDFSPAAGAGLAQIVRSIGVEHLRPIAPPPQEVPPRWRRIAGGPRHSKTRDAEAIHHHYDVSNTFYEWVLGPSMTYTCACYPHPDATLDEAQENKYRLVFEKLRLKPGDRLLDVGCGWGGMVRYAARRGVQGHRRHAVAGADVVGAAGHRRRRAGRPGRGALRRLPRHPRDRLRRGVVDRAARAHRRAQLSRRTSGFLQSQLRPGGLLLNHCITRPNNGAGRRPADSSTATSSRTASSPAPAASSPRPRMPVWRCCTRRTCATHYALTLRDWCANLVDHWDEAVEEVGLPTAKVWGLYMAGSRLGFETNVVQLHQVLAVKLDSHGRDVVFRCDRGGRPRASHQFRPRCPPGRIRARPQVSKPW